MIINNRNQLPENNRWLYLFAYSHVDYGKYKPHVTVAPSNELNRILPAFPRQQYDNKIRWNGCIFDIFYIEIKIST